jgi:hypothetical protein
MSDKTSLLVGEEYLEWYYFYSNREINAVTGYTAAEGFAYFMLRARCWDAGFLPDDMRKLVRWCNNAVTAEDVTFILEEHFEKNPEGVWVSPELETLRGQAMKYRTQKSEAGKRGAKVRWSDSKTIAPHGTAIAPLCDLMPREVDVDGNVDENGVIRILGIDGDADSPRNPSSGSNLKNPSANGSLKRDAPQVSPEVGLGLVGDEAPPPVPLIPKNSRAHGTNPRVQSEADELTDEQLRKVNDNRRANGNPPLSTNVAKRIFASNQKAA